MLIRKNATENFKLAAARHANTYGGKATLKNEKFSKIHPKTLNAWKNKFKKNQSLKDTRGGIEQEKEKKENLNVNLLNLIILIQHFNLRGNKYYGTRISTRAEIEILRRIELYRDLGAKVSLRTVQVTARVAVKLLGEAGCLTSMI